MSDAATWERLVPSDHEPLIHQHLDPPSYRREFAGVVAGAMGLGSSVLEAGCFTGLTSALLAEDFKCTLLDLSPHAVATARDLFGHLGLTAEYVVGDIFSMPFPNGTFDAVINSGVLEHFPHNQRHKALTEMVRVTRPGGMVCVGVPNHHSPPYRFGYLLRRATGRWRYPPEYRISSLAREFGQAGLGSIQRYVLSADKRLSQLDGFLVATALFRLVEKAIHRQFAGYLEVATGLKQPYSGAAQASARGSRQGSYILAPRGVSSQRYPQ